MRPRASRLTLFAFLVLVLGGGWEIGVFNRPGAWYAQLAKPAFTPPRWLFVPVWRLLHVLIAMAGWRTAHDHLRSMPMLLWWARRYGSSLWRSRRHFLSAVQLGLIGRNASSPGIVAKSS